MTADEYAAGLRRALVCAFDVAGLRRMVRDELGMDVERVVGLGGSLEEIAERVVGHFDKADRLPALLAGAHRANPTNEELMELVGEAVEAPPPRRRKGVRAADVQVDTAILQEIQAALAELQRGMQRLDVVVNGSVEYNSPGLRGQITAMQAQLAGVDQRLAALKQSVEHGPGGGPGLLRSWWAALVLGLLLLLAVYLAGVRV